MEHTLIQWTSALMLGSGGLLAAFVFYYARHARWERSIVGKILMLRSVVFMLFIFAVTWDFFTPYVNTITEVVTQLVVSGLLFVTMGAHLAVMVLVQKRGVRAAKIPTTRDEVCASGREQDFRASS